jgi:hypothetical protein
MVELFSRSRDANTSLHPHRRNPITYWHKTICLASGYLFSYSYVLVGLSSDAVTSHRTCRPHHASPAAEDHCSTLLQYSVQHSTAALTTGPAAAYSPPLQHSLQHPPQPRATEPAALITGPAAAYSPPLQHSLQHPPQPRTTEPCIPHRAATALPQSTGCQNPLFPIVPQPHRRRPQAASG